jgi:hypothetical protein
VAPRILTYFAPLFSNDFGFAEPVGLGNLPSGALLGAEDSFWFTDEASVFGDAAAALPTNTSEVPS